MAQEARKRVHERQNTGPARVKGPMLKYFKVCAQDR